MLPLPLLVALVTAPAPPAPEPERVDLEGPQPSFVAAVDVDPAGERVGVLLGSVTHGARLEVRDRDGTLVFLRGGLLEASGAIALGRATVAVVAHDDPHEPGPSLRRYAMSPTRDPQALRTQTAAPTTRIPLGDVAAQAVELSPDERVVAIACSDLVTGVGKLLLHSTGVLRLVRLPFAPSALAFMSDGKRIVVGGEVGTVLVDVESAQVVSRERGAPVSALAIVDGKLRVGRRADAALPPVALSARGALGCAGGRPAWLGPMGEPPAPFGEPLDDALPCARFAGGPALVGASHGIRAPAALWIWRSPSR